MKFFILGIGFVVSGNDGNGFVMKKLHGTLGKSDG